MSRRNVSAIVDVTESVKQLENELRILTTQKSQLLTSVGELEKQRDGLLAESSGLVDKLRAEEKKVKEESDKLLAIAEDKVKKANIRESESVNKQTDLNNKLISADNLIKSNTGLKANLDLQIAEVKEKRKKIEDFLELVKNNLKDI